MNQCGKPNCNNPDACQWPNCNSNVKTENESEYTIFWDNFDNEKYQNYLTAKANAKDGVRTYEYFVGPDGDLRFRPEKFKNTDITLSCKGICKLADHHEYGVYLS